MYLFPYADKVVINPFPWQPMDFLYPVFTLAFHAKVWSSLEVKMWHMIFLAYQGCGTVCNGKVPISLIFGLLVENSHGTIVPRKFAERGRTK